MFKRRTLFVVGAGASAEVGFPVGTQLARMIGKKLQPQLDQTSRITGLVDEELFDQLRREQKTRLEDYMIAARLISNGIRLANSIDDFLNVHSENEPVTRLGKAAIVKAILEAEKASKLYVDPNNAYNRMDFNKIEDTWFVKLMRVLGAGGSPEAVIEIFNGVGFIIFNYDRCLEHFLAHALNALYGLPRQKAEEVVRMITIIHPYGKVGELESGVPFGGDPHNPDRYFSLGERIRTYTEQITERDTVERMRNEVEHADCIVFLGFSYLEQNMALLKPDSPVARKPVFGTAYQMSKSDREVVAGQILRMMRPPPAHTISMADLVELDAITCAQLFDNYARSLNAPSVKFT